MPKESYRNQSRKEIIQFLPQEISMILEIGCGEWSFSKNIKCSGEKWGIEPDSKAANIAKNVFDKILIGTFDIVKADLPKNYFDLVICNDVIERGADFSR